MKTNVKSVVTKVTYEGAPARLIDAEKQLRRSVMANLLWENQFYESGEDIASRIKSLIPHVPAEKVAAIALEARSRMKLRHVPLLLVREMARHATHKHLVSQTLAEVIQRPDEIAEFVSIYWKDGKCPLSAQVKKGLARAFHKFSAYSLQKYDQDGAVKLRDAAFLSHPKAGTDRERGELLARLVNKSYFPEKTRSGFPTREAYGLSDYSPLPIADTWEVALSGGADKKETFLRLMAQKKLGALAFLRNLRNMLEAGISQQDVLDYSQTVDIERVLPFRFIAAARAVPMWEPLIESMMFRCLEGQEKLSGVTAIVVDNSGSMYGPKISAKSDLDRIDAACALAILIREIAAIPVVIGFGGDAAVIPARRGFALRDAIRSGPGGGTDTRRALMLAAGHGYDRVIVVTDEQSHTSIPDPLPHTKAYFINVACYGQGIGYGRWVHIDGWSESILEYIREYEFAEESTEC